VGKNNKSLLFHSSPTKQGVLEGGGNKLKRYQSKFEAYFKVVRGMWGRFEGGFGWLAAVVTMQKSQGQASHPHPKPPTQTPFSHLFRSVAS